VSGGRSVERGKLCRSRLRSRPRRNLGRRVHIVSNRRVA
jgi:hypothetical protein